MTDETKLAMVKTLSGESELSDEEVSVYLELAGMKIMNRLYPYGKYDSREGRRKEAEELEIPARYHALQCQIAAYMINRRGSEGEVSNIEVGTQRDYGSADVPDDMLSGIVPMVGVF